MSGDSTSPRHAPVSLRTDRLRAVGVSVGSDAAKESAARTLAAVRDRYPGVPLLAGGPGVPDATVARRLGGDGWAADADQLDALLSDMR